MNSSAATTEMKIRRFSAGQLRVHVGVARRRRRRPRFEKSSSKRPKKYWAVFTSAITARITDRCAFTWGVTRWSGLWKPDTAVEVVRDRGDEQHDHETGEQPLEHELDERQLEDVEADVLVELRILDAEVDAVREEDPLLATAPTRRSRRSARRRWRPRRGSGPGSGRSPAGSGRSSRPRASSDPAAGDAARGGPRCSRFA